MMNSPYEANLSALLGIKGRKFTFKKAKNNKFDEVLYRSVQTKLCQDALLLSELQYNISRCSRKPYAEGKTDTSSCYENIVRCLTSVVSQHNGMPKFICILHDFTLLQAKYHLKVMFNLSGELST